jgi:hypothetical protein
MRPRRRQGKLKKPRPRQGLLVRLLKREAHKLERDFVRLVWSVPRDCCKAVVTRVFEHPGTTAAVALTVLFLFAVSVVWQAVGEAAEEGAHLAYIVAEGVDDVVDGIEDAINAVGGAISKVAGFFGGHVSIHLDPLDLAGNLDEFKDRDTICHYFHDAWHVFVFPLQARLNADVCPVVRYVYATDAHPLLATALSWAYVDDDPAGANCALPAASAFCEGVNYWRALRYVWVPLIIVAYLASSFTDVILAAARFAGALVEFTVVLTLLLVQLVLEPSRFTSTTKTKPKAAV